MMPDSSHKLTLEVELPSWILADAVTTNERNRVADADGNRGHQPGY